MQTKDAIPKLSYAHIVLGRCSENEIKVVQEVTEKLIPVCKFFVIGGGPTAGGQDDITTQPFPIVTLDFEGRRNPIRYEGIDAMNLLRKAAVNIDNLTSLGRLL